MFQKIEFFDGKKVEGLQPFLNKLSKDNTIGILLLVAYAGSILKLNHKVLMSKKMEFENKEKKYFSSKYLNQHKFFLKRMVRVTYLNQHDGCLTT